jgi:hypothetical protein
MAELPLRIQEKITNYTAILTSRYPPNTPFWKLSVGYARPGDAEVDTTPVTTVYSSNDSQPTTGSLLYTDSSKTSFFNGSMLWFHLFNSSDSSLNITLQINDKGRVLDRTTF